MAFVALRFGCLVFTAISMLCTAFGQITQVPYDPSPFAVTGYITGATLNNASDILSGGTITVNNVDVVVPRNLLVNTPSLTALAWSELFNPDGTVNLPLWPEVNWEASIYANFIGGKHVAGIVYIFQELGNINEGFITHIDYANGEIRVGGSFFDGNTGVRLAINDPVGRYGKVHDEWPIWTADTDNPSIVASTGFPMCLPRVDPATGTDPLCPKTNRPVDAEGRPLSIFTFEAPPVAAGQPDPTIFAPLTVGDFIIYSGTIVEDANGRLIAAYSIEANLGLYTASGSKPAYFRLETLQAGIDGSPAGEIAETRVEGFCTDPTATINVFTIDVDPCTGDETERSWGTVVAQSAAPAGRWRFRSSDPSLSPYTREVGVRIAGGTLQTPNDITAGQYISPYPPAGLIFPELLVLGNPQLPHEFNLLPFLAKGSGPWLGIPNVTPTTATGPIVGQLDPWPGVTQPAPVTCSAVNPLVPIANAGADFVSVPGAPVSLVGTASNGKPPPGPLVFKWSQISGPSVQIQGSSNANATFLAPNVTVATSFVFALNISNSEGTSTDQVTVTINPVVMDHITFETVTWKSGKGSGTLTVIADTDSLSSKLFVSATNPNIANTPMTSLGAGRWQAVITIKPAPALVTVTTSLGGSASSPVA